jgi:hypothetical protein
MMKVGTEDLHLKVGSEPWWEPGIYKVFIVLESKEGEGMWNNSHCIQLASNPNFLYQIKDLHLDYQAFAGESHI